MFLEYDVVLCVTKSSHFDVLGIYGNHIYISA